MPVLITAISVIVILSTAAQCHGENVQLTKLPVKLPHPIADACAVYDGADSIYIVAGNNGTTGFSSILKFSITDKTITIVGETAPLKSPLCFWDGYSIVIFGGYEEERETDSIRRFVPGDSYSRHAGSLPWVLGRGCVVKLPGENATLIFGGGLNGNRILKYSSKNSITALEQNLPYEINGHSCVYYDESVYIFGGRWFDRVTHIIKFDVISGNSLILPNKLPVVFSSGTAVFNGKYIYLIGGKGFSVTTVLKLDPKTMAFDFTNSTDNPYLLYGGGAVYVKRDKMAYIFGGISYDSKTRYHDEISYLTF